MEEENNGDERPERAEGPSRKPAPQDSDSSKSKMISVVVGVVVVLVALLQFTRASQQQMRELELEHTLQQNRAQEVFREKAQQRRFDTIENNKQAEMLESQFKPMDQTNHPREP
ncbi:MAG: hypothetical protein HQL99_16030 [Magnetococcales bacterium]|nr:hypothetical protein [Magnetococcales bacterium]